MSMLERLLGASRKKAEGNEEQMKAQLKEKLKGLLYDDELVEEMVPIFLGLQGKPGFDKIVELLETKEKQIEAISGGDWFKKESDANSKVEKEEEDETDSSVNLVESILKTKYETKS